MLRLSLVALATVSALAPLAPAQVFDERFDDWPVRHRIGGVVAVAGSLDDVRALGDARLRLDEDARVLLLLEKGVDEPRVRQYRELLAGDDDSGRTLDVVRYGDSLPDDLVARLADCDALCWESVGAESRIGVPALAGVRDALAGLVDRGGLVLAVGPGARFLGHSHRTGDGPEAPVAPGLDLVPDTVIDTTYRGAEDRGELLGVLAPRQRLVGVGLAPGTALVLDRRRCRVVGKGTAEFLLMANDRQPVRAQTITPQRERRQSPKEYLVDLTEWRRDAIDRTLEPFPPAEPYAPVVENGTLLIVGGGGLPDGLIDRFIELAGGAEEARLVYVPCSERGDVGASQRTVEGWKQRGVKNATFIHTKDRLRANTDEEILGPLRGATGIWFGGGRQWNFADSYYGTEAHRLMKDVLRRGGVIGGSSAGASIQGRYLARATPIQNFEIMAPGYERGGLGFLGGVAIDQHFTQRGRQKDMTQLVDRYPQLLGIGIDETTALVVTKSRARVVGKGRVCFYDRRLPVMPGQLDHVALPAGSEFDLVARQVTVDTRGAARGDGD